MFRSLFGNLLWKAHEEQAEKEKDLEGENPTLSVKQLRKDLADNQDVQEAIRKVVRTMKDLSSEEENSLIEE